VNNRSLPFLASPEQKKELKHYLNLTAENQTFSAQLPEPRKLQIANLVTRTASPARNQKNSAEAYQSKSTLSKWSALRELERIYSVLPNL
jgi:hypothetical protein